jgi:hypothetical protein
MKSHKRLAVTGLSFLLAITAAASASAAEAGEAPRVTRNAMATVEKNLDNRFTRLWDDNPFVVLGNTRGIYLEGYGAVFTAEINLVAGPAAGILPLAITNADRARHKDKKLSRLPEFKRALAKALAETAASPQMAAVPPDEQIVLVAFLSHYPWEDLSGMPAQITMQGAKKKLIEAGPTGGATLEAAIQVAQN